MAKETVQLDQRKLLDRLERLEKQVAKGGKRRGGGLGTALKAFTFGSLVGGGVALLYAPQKGEQTRQQLLQRSAQMKDQAAQAAGQAQQAAGQIKDQAQQSVNQVKDQLQSSAAEAPSAATTRPTPDQAVAQQRPGRTYGTEGPA